VKLTLKVEIIVENCIMFSTVIGQFAYCLCLMVRPYYARFVICDSSKLAIFYSYKICKQCKWTYLSNLHVI